MNYKALANHLAQLDSKATCADLAVLLNRYEPLEEEYRQKLQAAVAELPVEANWLKGAEAIAWVLYEGNPRFVIGLWMDWVTEEL